MPEIVLTDEQVRQIEAADGPVTVRDARGNVFGGFRVDKITPDEIAELKQRAAGPGPRYTTAQVLARLEALQAERDRIGPFDKAHADALLDRLDQQDPGHFRDPG